MSILNILLYLILSIYTHSPVYLINEFINGLQITSNPDTYLTPPQIITRHGYPAETYNIQTPVGFILELHRIPNAIKQGPANQYPVLLVHGYMDSSAEWIALGPDQALPYLLADEGYDVWMLNTRGNTFSRAHANYTPKQHEFWDFSFHEIGVYDVPTPIDFILDKSNHPKLFCISHSAGGSEIYIALSVLPQYNEKVIAQVSLAPLYHGAPSTVMREILPIIDHVYNYFYWNTPGSQSQHDLLMKIIIFVGTIISPFGYNGYDFALFLLFGLLPSHVNWEIMPTVYNTYPAGSSAKATLHLFQTFNSFSYFDYGPKMNMEVYGTASPPEYNISNIITPTRIYHDHLDIASSDIEILSLYNKLPAKAGLIKIRDPGFTHLDFVLNKNAKKLVYDDVITFVNHVTNNIL